MLEIAKNIPSQIGNDFFKKNGLCRLYDKNPNLAGLMNLKDIHPQKYELLSNLIISPENKLYQKQLESMVYFEEQVLSVLKKIEGISEEFKEYLEKEIPKTDFSSLIPSAWSNVEKNIKIDFLTDTNCELLEIKRIEEHHENDGGEVYGIMSNMKFSLPDDPAKKYEEILSKQEFNNLEKKVLQFILDHPVKSRELLLSGFDKVEFEWESNDVIFISTGNGKNIATNRISVNINPFLFGETSEDFESRKEEDNLNSYTNRYLSEWLKDFSPDFANK